MRLTVLGAGGFIGHAVCEELLRQQIDFVAWGRGELASLPGDRRDTVCIHLASPNRLPTHSAEAATMVAANLALAEKIERYGFSSVIYASSAGVYGDRHQGTVKETDKVEPQDEYAAFKLSCEEVFSGDRHGIARIANVYGPGMARGNVLNDVFAQLQTSAPISIRNGRPVRDYVAVADVAKALVAMATRRLTGVFNVGTGIGHSVRQMIELVLAIHGVQREIVETAASTQESRLVLDASKLKLKADWQAKTEFRQGLRELLATQSSEVV